MDLVGRAAAKKLRMRAETRVSRLLLAKQRRNRTVEEWKRVVFSDECKFSLNSDGRVYVCRTTGTRCKPENTIEKTTSRFSMMFWGCISGNWSRVLLQTILICWRRPESTRWTRTSFSWMTTVPSIDRGKLSSGFMTMVLRKSSAPIQPRFQLHRKCLGPMKRELNAMHLTLDTLEEAVYSVWNNVKDSFIEKLYSSMPNRISQCIRNSGFSIKYLYASIK